MGYLRMNKQIYFLTRRFPERHYFCSKSRKFDIINVLKNIYIPCHPQCIYLKPSQNSTNTTTEKKLPFDSLLERNISTRTETRDTDPN